MLKDFPYFHGIDGRSASIVMGENRWESPKYYYWKMQGKVVLEKSEALEWGKKHSQLIRDEFVLRSGLNVIEPDNVLFIHPDHDFIIAYVNYVVPDEGAVLITKTCSEFTKKYWDKGKVPDEAYIEAQHDMAVTGMNKVFIALLAGGNKYFQFEISRDEERIEQIILREKLFYDNCILAIDVPEFTGIGDEEKAVNGMFKCEDNKDVMELDDDYEERVMKRKKVLEEKTKYEKLVKKYNCEIKFKMGKNKRASTKNHNIKIIEYDKPDFDYKALLKKHPEFEEKYLKKTPVKRLQIREK